MKQSEAVNLTRLMRAEGILRISCTPHGFSVYLTGDILGTGTSVGEAYQSAMRQREAAASAVAVAA